MGRRSDHSREELKELAIISGVELVEKEGLAGFRARKVAVRMGYTVGTLYHVFGSLDDFVLCINARTLDEWYGAINKVVSRPRKEDNIIALAKAYIQFVRKNYGRWSLLFGYTMAKDKEIPDWYQEKVEKLFKVVEEAMLPHAGGDRKKAYQAARVLWASVHGICVLSMSGKLDVANVDSAEAMAKTLVGYVLGGVKG